MTTRTLLLCCGAIASLAALQPPIASASWTTTQLQPAANQDPLAFPGSVLEYAELVIPAGETLVLQGPVELRVGGEVRIEGKLVVDGVESRGRPNLTIHALGPISIPETGTMQTISHGPGAHGGSIRLHSAVSIDLHGKLLPSAGNDANAPLQHGGSGADIFIEAPLLKTSLERIEATNGGDGGPAANGGNGGSVEIHANVLWTGDPIIDNTTIVAGHAGNGGHGYAEATNIELRSGGDAGDGGHASFDTWRHPSWLEELNYYEHPDQIMRSAYEELKGKEGTPGQKGGTGAHGIDAVSGNGGRGGDGVDAQVTRDSSGTALEIIPAGNGGNGGSGGQANGGAGANGGGGGDTGRLDPKHPMYGKPAGNGGFGGSGGDARAGNGGDGGKPGFYPNDPDIPAARRGQYAHPGHAGHAGQASGGHGGHGGHGGQGYGPVPEGGQGGLGGTAAPGYAGIRWDPVRVEGEPERTSGHARTGFDGKRGHDGHSHGPPPKP